MICNLPNVVDFLSVDSWNAEFSTLTMYWLAVQVSSELETIVEYRIIFNTKSV